MCQILNFQLTSTWAPQICLVVWFHIVVIMKCLFVSQLWYGRKKETQFSCTKILIFCGVMSVWEGEVSLMVRLSVWSYINWHGFTGKWEVTFWGVLQIDVDVQVEAASMYFFSSMANNNVSNFLWYKVCGAWCGRVLGRGSQFSYKYISNLYI